MAQDIRLIAEKIIRWYVFFDTLGTKFELFLKRTPTSDKLLADSELRYPYEGSKTLMYAFDRFEDMDLITELLKGMYAELPEKKPKKAK